MNYISTKLFREFPTAYRNHNSKSDCYLLHGYCRDVYIQFYGNRLDKQGFVVDFGELGPVKDWLNEKFDHTTVLQADDPSIPDFVKLSQDGHLSLTLLPLVSCEGWAEYIAKYVDNFVQQKTDGRAGVLSVEVRENDKNSGIYINRRSSGELIDTHTYQDLLDLVEDMRGPRP